MAFPYKNVGSKFDTKTHSSTAWQVLVAPPYFLIKG